MKQHAVKTRTITMNVVDEGAGPLLLFCHGFPETSYAWRHQVRELATTGFRTVAPDLRGYGASDRPEAVDAYTLFHIVGDLVALLDALHEQTAVIIGNDWGATIAWQAAQMRPDRFRAVVAMGVPMMAPAPVRPTTMFPQTPEALFYILYFQQIGVADSEFAQDAGTTLRKIMFAASGEAGSRRDGDDTPNPFGFVSRKDGLLAALPEPLTLPAWLTERDLDRLAQAFIMSGFTGALNYYRNLDRNWELGAALAGTTVSVPALYMAGERDPGLQIPDMTEIIDAMPNLVPQLQASIIVEGAGHWLPQERPTRVTDAIRDFARALT